MLYLVPLILFTLGASFLLKKVLSDSYRARIISFNELDSNFANTAKECAALKELNSSLGGELEGTVELYDVTKDICKSLDEGKIFNLFKERLSNYINITECQFIKDAALLPKSDSFFLLPLEVNRNRIGFLAVKGLREEEKDKFFILAQQFLLGIQRSLLYKKVQELTITDSLTALYSRRYFLEKLDEEIARSAKFKLKFSFLMIDIDHFKTINDSYGHLVGDAVIKDVSRIIKESVRQVDFIGRYGGEEISLVLIETAKPQALLVAERIRQAIENRVIAVYDETLKVTISIGISAFPHDAAESLKLIDKADIALYQAKQAGRNKVRIFS